MRCDRRSSVPGFGRKACESYPNNKRRPPAAAYTRLHQERNNRRSLAVAVAVTPRASAFCVVMHITTDKHSSAPHPSASVSYLRARAEQRLSTHHEQLKRGKKTKRNRCDDLVVCVEAADHHTRACIAASQKARWTTYICVKETPTWYLCPSDRQPRMRNTRSADDYITTPPSASHTNTRALLSGSLQNETRAARLRTSNGAAASLLVSLSSVAFTSSHCACRVRNPLSSAGGA